MIKRLCMGRATAGAKAAEIKCSFRSTVNCPLNGKCLVEGIVFITSVESINGQHKVYIGSTEGTLKTRYYNYKPSFKLIMYKTAQTF